MTYSRAKLIIWNFRAYSREEVSAATIFILGALDASQEDLSQAYMLAAEGR